MEKLPLRLQVSDVSASMSAPYDSNEHLWEVTFVRSGVGGDVEALQIRADDDLLTGSGARLRVYADGPEKSSDIRSSATAESRAGSELGGSFTLTCARGHTTEPIEFNAAASTMKARLEALPNVGNVDVLRSAPGSRRGRVDRLAVSNPGYFPPNSRNLALLVPDTSDLEGTGASCEVKERLQGSEPLKGAFQLMFCNSTRADGYAGSVAVHDLLENDLEAPQFEAILEDLDHVGDVDVSRVTNSDGYTWYITFGGCSLTEDLEDVCNEGDVALMKWLDSRDTDLLCYGEFSPVSVFTVRAPRAPLAPTAPRQGSTGGIGTVAPGDASIAVHWDAPVDNGGSNITSYQLWMAPPGREFSKVALDAEIPSVDKLPGRSVVMRHVVDQLSEGELYRFYVPGRERQGTLEQEPSDDVWSSAIETALGCSGCVDVVGNAGYSSSNKTISFRNQGSIDLIAVDEESIVTVERVLSGSSELTGTFTLSYNGAETEAIDVDATAEDVKAYLEDLSTLSVVEAGVVYEQQVVSLDLSGGDAYLRLGAGYEWSAALTGQSSTTKWMSVLQNDDLAIGAVHVTRSNSSWMGTSTGTYTITFLDRVGDVPLLELSADDSGFTIEPKKASGAPLRDLTAARKREGEDVFYTELWEYDEDGEYVHYADGGVATCASAYNPATYEIQKLVFDAGYSGDFTISLNQSSRADGVNDKTAALSSGCTAYQMKIALEALDNVEAVDVSRNGSAATGLSYAAGITEIQTIILSDAGVFEDGPRAPVLHRASAAAPIFAGYFTLRLGDGTDYTTSLDLTSATNAEVEAALEALDGVYDVSVSDGTADSGSFTGNAWDVTFHSPVGDVSNLVVLDSDGDDDGDVTYNVVELVRTARGNHKLQLDFNVRVKGDSGLAGTYTVAYEGSYSADIAFEASAEDVKAALEDLDTIDEARRRVFWRFASLQQKMVVPSTNSLH
ncbi:hypothetical protein JL721_2556 [Aureococcus anophagefferens]|nr:hypothetical protein JL721_2556 [Aureococcus anophagefferens]